MRGKDECKAASCHWDTRAGCEDKATKKARLAAEAEAEAEAKAKEERRAADERELDADGDLEAPLGCSVLSKKKCGKAGTRCKWSKSKEKCKTISADDEPAEAEAKAVAKAEAKAEEERRAAEERELDADRDLERDDGALACARLRGKDECKAASCHWDTRAGCEDKATKKARLGAEAEAEAEAQKEEKEEEEEQKQEEEQEEEGRVRAVRPQPSIRSKPQTRN